MPRAPIAFIFAWSACLAPCCGGRTGLGVRGDAGHATGNPSEILPADDGSCPPPTSPCGAGGHAPCYALDSDATNCGACGHACTPGIACVAGACQQTKCSGPVAFHQIASYPTRLSGTADYPYVDYAGADMNRDGRLDLLEFNGAGDLVIWLGQGDGTFAAATAYPTVGKATTPASSYYAPVGDLNEDGLMDLVVTKANGDSVELRPGLPGGGLGGRAGDVLGMVGARLSIADLDGDGHLDVVSGHDTDGALDRIHVFRGRGDGTFASAGTYPFTDDLFGGFTVQDWDGDGAVDLLVTGNNLHILHGNGDGTFAGEQRCGLDGGGFVDLNQDGKLDLVWSLWPAPRWATVLGSGDCEFPPLTTYPAPADGSGLALGDLSGDGVMDVVLPSPSGRTGLYLGNIDGTFTAAPDLPIAIQASDLFIADVNDDGRADIVATGDGFVVFSNTCDR